MSFLEFNISDFNFDDLVKDTILLEVKHILSNININLILDKNDSTNYRGCCFRNKEDISKFDVYINIKKGLEEDIFYFNKRGILGDIFNPNGETFMPKNNRDIGVYSILFTILHEYKHYIQYKEGRLDNIDISLSNNKYISPKAQSLEIEAEQFALDNINNALNNNLSFLIK